ncbi:MAG TPA: GNAT family N-acetyltransferase [Gemmatimonadaceae bacterium]|nr:GNAT family N-acetyltransferase [Gemmatimonadaceae bacterium]
MKDRRSEAHDGGGPLTIRRATPSDLDVVVALRLALLREYGEHPIYGRLRPDAETRARPIFASQIDADREVIFLAEVRHAAVGMLRCVESISSPLLVPDRYCYVSSVYVTPGCRRQGVLRALLGRARDWCDERGLTEMRLHNVGSRPSSAAAWDALGFEVVEQVRLLRLDRSEPSVSMSADVETAAPLRP